MAPVLLEFKCHALFQDRASDAQAISACDKSGQWQRALDLLHVLEAGRTQPLDFDTAASSMNAGSSFRDGGWESSRSKPLSSPNSRELFGR